MKKHCCKNCDCLDYYDGYFCKFGINKLGVKKAKDGIDDIENCKCEMFQERKGKFWLYKDAEF